jgi:hypothetical protein
MNEWLNEWIWLCSLEPIFTRMGVQNVYIVIPKHTHTHSVTHFAWISTSKENDKAKFEGMDWKSAWGGIWMWVWCSEGMRLRGESCRRLEGAVRSPIGDFVVADMHSRYQDISVFRSQQGSMKICLELCLLHNAFHPISSFFKTANAMFLGRGGLRNPRSNAGSFLLCTQAQW